MIKYCNENESKSNKNKKLILPTQIANKITFHDGFCQLRQFFAEYEESTLIRCLDLCQEIEGGTEKVLLKEGQVDDCSIYFILQGKVQIVDRNCQIVFSKKETGQYFGEYAFYTQHPRSATVISDGCCRLLKLRRADFLNCLSRLDKVMMIFIIAIFPTRAGKNDVLRKLQMVVLLLQQLWTHNQVNEYPTIHSQCP